MSIKESALTAVTSIASGDFIRVVTSSGASRRIALANLFRSASIESGTITGSSVAAGSTMDYNVTYTKTFGSTPQPVACFSTTSTASGFGNCTLAVLNRSRTGFTVRVYNNDTAARVPSITWIAI